MKTSAVPPRVIVGALVLAAGLGLASVDAHAQAWREQADGMPNTPPAELEGVDIVEHLGQPLPREARFHNSEGTGVKLGDYFDGKRPTVFVFAYHTCPMLCSLVLDAAVKSLNDVAWTVGNQFDVVSLSIDPRDTPETANRKRAQVVSGYPRANGSTRGWNFLVGDEEDIRKVTDAVGFKYRYDARQKQYAHPAAIYILTPEGRLGRYLYGIQYDPNDVRLGLLESSEGRSITTTERLLLFCYHYDPQGKRYALVAMNVMRLGGAVTVIAIGSFLAIMWVRGRRERKTMPPAVAPKNLTPPTFLAARKEGGTRGANLVGIDRLEVTRTEKTGGSGTASRDDSPSPRAEREPGGEVFFRTSNRDLTNAQWERTCAPRRGRWS